MDRDRVGANVRVEVGVRYGFVARRDLPLHKIAHRRLSTGLILTEGCRGLGMNSKRLTGDRHAIIAGIVGEGAMILWLLVMGVNSERWNERASKASESNQSVPGRAAV